MAQETRPAQTPFSEEKWSQTPAAVQEFLLSLIMQVQEPEAEIVDLSERVNRNSHNWSGGRVTVLPTKTHLMLRG